MFIIPSLEKAFSLNKIKARIDRRLALSKTSLKDKT